VYAGGKVLRALRWTVLVVVVVMSEPNRNSRLETSSNESKTREITRRLRFILSTTVRGWWPNTRGTSAVRTDTRRSFSAVSRWPFAIQRSFDRQKTLLSVYRLSRADTRHAVFEPFKIILYTEFVPTPRLDVSRPGPKRNRRPCRYFAYTRVRISLKIISS